MLVREGLEELGRLGTMIVNAMRRRLARPRDDDVGLVSLAERVQVLGVPGIVTGYQSGRGGPEYVIVRRGRMPCRVKSVAILTWAARSYSR